MRLLTFNAIKNYVDSVKKDTRLFDQVQTVRAKINQTFGHMGLDEVTHTYHSSKDPGKKYVSVTKLIEKFVPEKDWQMIAEQFAIKNKRDVQDVQDEWSVTGIKARALGTRTHLFGEAVCTAILSYMDGKSDDEVMAIMEDMLGRQVDITDGGEKCLVPVSVNEEKVSNFWIDIVDCQKVSLVPVAAELKIENDNLGGYAGCIDLLMWSAESNKIVVMDYKTNGSLENSFARKGNERLLSPFSELINEALSEYTLQLAYYARALVDGGAITKDDIDDFVLIHVNSIGGKYKSKPEYNLVRVDSLNYIDRLV